jgi:hypothetical protein
VEELELLDKEIKDLEAEVGSLNLKARAEALHQILLLKQRRTLLLAGVTNNVDHR